MAYPAPAATRLTSERYFSLFTNGTIDPDDRVELLEGVVVAMSPSNPPHAAITSQVARVLTQLLGERASVRVQSPLVVGRRSVPEPDVAVVAGAAADYYRAHPTSALLVVEVADRSLAQDRITKATIYAKAEVPEYWIVNLRAGCVEVYRSPDARAGLYGERRVAGRGDTLALAALPEVTVRLDDVLPPRP